MRNPSVGASSSKVGLKRGPWTAEEDELLVNYIRREGEGRWRTLPKRAGLLRCGKSCRLRWMNYLRPSVKRGQIAPDEEDLILRLHRLLGNRWSLIAGRIPGRTDNEIKNYWNTHLSKKLISQGIDPRTHKPLNPNPNSSAGDQAPAPKSNPKPSSSCLEEMGCGGSDDVVKKDHNKYLKGTANLDQDHNWQNSDGLMMGLESSHGNSNEDDDIDYCTDDIFSSFLNSLINEDVFVNQQQQQQLNVIAPPDPLVSASAQTFGYGAMWESALLSSSRAAFKDEEHKPDHVNKRV